MFGTDTRMLAERFANALAVERAFRTVLGRTKRSAVATRNRA